MARFQNPSGSPWSPIRHCVAALRHQGVGEGANTILAWSISSARMPSRRAEAAVAPAKSNARPTALNDGWGSATYCLRPEHAWRAQVGTEDAGACELRGCGGCETTRPLPKVSQTDPETSPRGKIAAGSSKRKTLRLLLAVAGAQQATESLARLKKGKLTQPHGERKTPCVPTAGGMLAVGASEERRNEALCDRCDAR